MNITQENVDALNAEINIHLSPEDYKEDVNAELKRQAKRASLPGFRPGKVPTNVIRRMVGMSVLMEELNKKINSELNSYISENKIRILGEPLPKDQKKEEDFDVNCNADLDFAFEVGLAPEIELNLKVKKAPAVFKVDLDDSFVEDEITKNQERYGEVIQPEKVEKGDIVYGKLNELGEDGNPLPEGEGYEKMIVLNPARIEKVSVFKPFVGKEVDAVLPFDVFKIHKDLEEIASLTFIDKDELEGLKDKKLQITLKRINRIQDAELNADFFFKVLNPQQAYQQTEVPEEGKVESEEEFRAELRKRIETEFEEHAKWYYRKQVREGLLEGHGIELPEAFLKKWIKEASERKEGEPELTPEQVDEQYVAFSENVRWSLLIEEVQKAHPEIKVEDEDLKDAIREMIYKNVPGMDKDREEEFMEHAMKNEEIVQGQYNRLFDEKLYDLLDEQLKPKNKKIAAKKFLELVNEEK